MTLRAVVAVVLSCVLAGSAACGASDNPARPSPGRSPYLGRWSGSMVDSVSGSGTAVLVFDRQLDAISLRGTWESSFPDGAGNESGSASATALDDTSFVIYMTPEMHPPCGSITVPGVIGVVATVSGNRLTGEYVSPRCGVVKSGSLDLTRQ